MDELKNDPNESDKSKLLGFAKHLSSQKKEIIRLTNVALSRNPLDKKDLYAVLDAANNIPT